MTNSQDTPPEEIVYTRKLGWMPIVIRKDNALFIQLGAGANANHEPRTFSIPITETHLAVIKADFARHLLLWEAILPLCDAAGTDGSIDESAAMTLCNIILLGTEAEVEEHLQKVEWNDSNLIAHHADIRLLAEGHIFAATQSLTLEADPTLSAEHAANRRRAQRGVYLTILDAAILKYTGQYLYGATLPKRNPDAVDPELLPQVLEIIATAEKACAGMEFPWDYDTDDTRYAKRDKEEWNKMKNVVEDALRETYPTLLEDSVTSVSFLMCREAASRAHARIKQK